jgi:hypothetical protein
LICMRGSKYPRADAFLHRVLTYLSAACEGLTGPHTGRLPTCVFCLPGGSEFPDATSAGMPTEFYEGEQILKNPCHQSTNRGQALVSERRILPTIGNCVPDYLRGILTDLERRCACVVVLCRDSPQFAKEENICETLIHELIHCGGISHKGDYGPIFDAADCIVKEAYRFWHY